jgi:hypothetical protein
VSTGRFNPMRWWPCAALIICGCDAQVTPAYQGDRLVEIRGNIVSDDAFPPAEAVLIWWSGDGLSTSVTTAGTFPAAFTLSVYDHPPDGALLDLGGPGPLAFEIPGLTGGATVCLAPPVPAAAGARVAIAQIAAVRPGTTPDRAGDNLVGLAADFALVFAPAALPTAGTFLVPSSGTVLTPGYHLMKVESADTASAVQCQAPASRLRLVECDEGLSKTQIELRIRAG